MSERNCPTCIDIRLDLIYRDVVIVLFFFFVLNLSWFRAILSRMMLTANQ